MNGGALQLRVQQVGFNLHARKQAPCHARHRLLVGKSGCGRADQQQLALDQCRRHFACGKTGEGDAPERAVRGKVDAGILRPVRLRIALSATRDQQRVERRERGAVLGRDWRHLADDAVIIGHELHRPQTCSGRCQHRRRQLLGNNAVDIVLLVQGGQIDRPRSGDGLRQLGILRRVIEKEHIVGNGLRAIPGQDIQHPGMFGARPWPAAKRGQARLVDFHNQDAIIDRRRDQPQRLIVDGVVDHRQPLVGGGKPRQRACQERNEKPFAIEPPMQHRLFRRGHGDLFEGQPVLDHFAAAFLPHAYTPAIDAGRKRAQADAARFKPCLVDQPGCIRILCWLRQAQLEAVAAAPFAFTTPMKSAWNPRRSRPRR